MAENKAELEKEAAEREAQLDEAKQTADMREAELGLMAEEKATLEKADAERNQHIASLIEMFSDTSLGKPQAVFSPGLGEDGDEEAFIREWIEKCEAGGGSWGEKNGFRAIVVDEEPAWECTVCEGGYFAYNLEPTKEEFWMSFECCEPDCALAQKLMAATGSKQGSRASTPSRRASSGNSGKKKK